VRKKPVEQTEEENDRSRRRAIAGGAWQEPEKEAEKPKKQTGNQTPKRGSNPRRWTKKGQQTRAKHPETGLLVRGEETTRSRGGGRPSVTTEDLN